MTVAKEKPDNFRALFVDGLAPDESERNKYQPYSYRAQRPVVARGDEFPVMVDLTYPMTGESAGEAEWIVQKVGEKWKLKAAPLP